MTGHTNPAEIALGRASAALVALMALMDYFQHDQRMAILLFAHTESARATLLTTRIPEAALEEFDRSVRELRRRLPSIPDQP